MIPCQTGFDRLLSFGKVGSVVKVIQYGLILTFVGVVVCTSVMVELAMGVKRCFKS